LKAQINNLAPGPLQQVPNLSAKKPANNNKVLKIRRTYHIVKYGIEKANKIFPAENKLSYDIYLVAIQHVFPRKEDYKSHGFNFLFSDGTGTKYPPYGASPSDWKTVPLQDHHKDQVKIIRVHTDSLSYVLMIEMFGLDGTLLLRAGDLKGDVVKDFELQQGERIIGVQGCNEDGDKHANIQDIQFVIGRLE